MKTGIFIFIIAALIAFVEPALANQLENQVTGIRSNLIILAQAVGGITLCIGFIIWNTGQADLGSAIAKGGLIGLVGASLLPSIIKYIQVLGT